MSALLEILTSQPEIPLPTAFACAAEALAVPHEAALLGMLFSMVGEPGAGLREICSAWAGFGAAPSAFPASRSGSRVESRAAAWRTTNYPIGRPVCPYYPCSMKFNTAGSTGPESIYWK